MEKYKDIIDFYLEKWIKLWNYETPCIRDIWFIYSNINKLFNLIKQQELLVKTIEVFTWENIDFYPPDFYYNKNNINENYELLKKFLANYNKDNNLYFTLFFNTPELENYINTLLVNKYKKYPSEKEVKERKNQWWEFID